MTGLQIVALLLFVLGYVAITFEHRWRTHKSGVGLALAGVLWLIVAFSGMDKEHISHAVEAAGAEVFSLIVFLLAAMTLVEVMLHFGFFDVIQEKLTKRGLDARQQFILIAVLTFFLSALLDNLTVTIIMIQIARRFYKGELLYPVAAGIVVAANAGGAWSPVGDVTTILLWLAEKFTAPQVIAQAILPSMVLAAVSVGLISRRLPKMPIEKEPLVRDGLTRTKKLIITAAMASFLLPVGMNLVGLPPYMGLLLGLGVVWLMIEISQHPKVARLDTDTRVEALLSKTDLGSIKFFIGILLAVSALTTLGVLEHISSLAFGSDPSFNRLIIGNSALGLFSAIVDNVPLTAIAIDVIKVQDPAIWVMLALAVGTGGSALVIGSAAGVVAMGMVRGLNFGRYMRIATIPVLIGYVAGIATWYVQHMIIS